MYHLPLQEASAFQALPEASDSFVNDLCIVWENSNVTSMTFAFPCLNGLASLIQSWYDCESLALQSRRADLVGRTFWSGFVQEPRPPDPTGRKRRQLSP